MAQLLKIKEVYLYTSQKKASAADCLEAKKLLDDAGVDYKHLWYEDETQHPQVFSALSTWFWGPTRTQRAFDDFPIVHWTECFDDFEQHIHHSAGLAELQASNLLKNAALARK
jgi:hypothetical protein